MMDLHWTLARLLVGAADDPSRILSLYDARVLSNLGLAAYDPDVVNAPVRVVLTNLGRDVADRHRYRLAKRSLGTDRIVYVHPVRDSWGEDTAEWGIFTEDDTCIEAGLDSWIAAQERCDAMTRRNYRVGAAMQTYREILASLAARGAAEGIDLSDGSVPVEVCDLLTDQGDARLDHTGTLLTLTLQGQERAAAETV